MADPTPAAEDVPAGHFPGPPVERGHLAPCPRRIRAYGNGGWVVDTSRAFYVWEHPYYPQYAVPVAGLPDDLVAQGRSVPSDERLAGHIVLDFSTAQAWFEEDERVYGHPRSPYTRVDALRSGRGVEVLVEDDDGTVQVLAKASNAVVVFETGLPPRWYLDPTTVDWSLMTPTDTVTRCPYKGLTSGYWSAAGIDDVAWSYAAPTAALQAIAGLLSFDDTKVDVVVDGDMPGSDR